MSLEKAQREIDYIKSGGRTTLILDRLWLTSDDFARLINANIECFQQITSLSLERNYLGSIPSEIGSLARLRKLDMSHNSITDISSALGKLTSLESLCMSHNHLGSIPSEIGSLARLRALDMSYSQITDMPSALGRLTSLESLSMSHNQIDTIFPEVGNLTQLRHLDMSSNHIRYIPSEVGRLVQLRSLDMSCNQITDISGALASLEEVSTLRLGPNPLVHAAISFLTDLSNARPGVDINFCMVAHERVNNVAGGIDKLYPIKAERTAVSNKIDSLEWDDKQNVKTFLCRIQNSTYWRESSLFDKYIKKTIRDMFSAMGYNEAGERNQILQDIIQSSAGCATNSTGTIFLHYVNTEIVKWQEENGRVAIEYQDLVRVEGSLGLDIIQIALQEYSNTLINENNISGDRVEIIADLLRIVKGRRFKFQGGNYAISNPLNLPDSISGYGITANDRAKALFLTSLCDVSGANVLDFNNLTISEAKLETLVNNYLSMHNISVASEVEWSKDLGSVLRDPSKVIPGDALGYKKSEIRELYQKLFIEFHQEIEGNEFISDLTSDQKSKLLMQDVGSEEEYLDKVLNHLKQTLREIAVEQGKSDEVNHRTGVSSIGGGVKGVTIVALCSGGVEVANMLGFDMAYVVPALAVLGGAAYLGSSYFSSNQVSGEGGFVTEGEFLGPEIGRVVESREQKQADNIQVSGADSSALEAANLRDERDVRNIRSDFGV